MDALYKKMAVGTEEEVEARLLKSIEDHGFRLLSTLDLPSHFAAAGIDFNRFCRIYCLCRMERAAQFLDIDMDFAAALPCRIVLYRKDGRLYLAALSPGYLLAGFSCFGAPEEKASRDVEWDFMEIMDEAAQNSCGSDL
jgi:uncharacterized protein (DUF302 family)